MVSLKLNFDNENLQINAVKIPKVMSGIIKDCLKGITCNTMPPSVDNRLTLTILCSVYYISEGVSAILVFTITSSALSL